MTRLAVIIVLFTAGLGLMTILGSVTSSLEKALMEKSHFVVLVWGWILGSNTLVVYRKGIHKESIVQVFFSIAALGIWKLLCPDSQGHQLLGKTGSNSH